VSWCVGGDFNITRFPSKRSGSASLDSAMMEFSELIFDQGLMDLPLAGGCFTWPITQGPLLWSRLDRFLVSPELEEWFPGILQKRLPRLCSDHFPILLDTGEVSRGRRSFKFENMWLKVDGFVALVK
jgi:endonuclease/exonuclease/phosphatase family metal-dependent hydrolase